MGTNTRTAAGSAEDETRRSVLLRELNPITVIEKLPPNVFPVECRFEVRRKQTQDTEHERFREPKYPVSVYESSGTYIPETTVHFDNPVNRAPENAVAWRPAEFTARLTELFDSEVAAGIAAEEVTLTRFTVVEVPHHLVTTDAETGDPVVKPELYEDRGEMTIARFRKHNSLSAASVRNELADSLPGESRTPARLTDLEEVTAKPARHGDTTIGQSGRARYYTRAEAEASGDISRTPAHYQSRYLDRSSEDTRPLAPAVSGLSEFLPALSDAEELVTVVRFVGHEQEKRSFVATEVLE